MMKYTVPFISFIQNRDVFLTAFSQYAQGPAFIFITTESCPGVACGSDKTYERVSLGQYQACFGGSGPDPVGSHVFVTCQGAGSIVLTFEETQFLGVSPECSISEPNLWLLTLSFDSIVREDCVVTSIVGEGDQDHCQNACPV